MFRPLAFGLVLLAFVALVTGALVRAQGSSFEVSGVTVDVTAKSAEAARTAGWRIAQRKGWALLARRLGVAGAGVSDATLDSLVSGIVVENEQIGPTRYIARLGVRFDRDRAAALLGVSAALTRSPPLLLLPIEWSGGAPVAFERESEWLKAWARFNNGTSSIDYVRPAGGGPDSLLLNHGQLNRRSRGWWRSILAQYGARDVVMPIVHLYRLYPGGPVIGEFQARFGPDNRAITQFSLQVRRTDDVPALLDAGVKRLDEAYQQALATGLLRVDASLNEPEPALPVNETGLDESILGNEEQIVAEAPVSQIAVQVDTPNPAALDAAQAALRALPGMRQLSVQSIALGGISVLRAGYQGDANALRAALEARGWQVVAGGGALRLIRQSRIPPNLIPDLPVDNSTAG